MRQLFHQKQFDNPGHVKSGGPKISMRNKINKNTQICVLDISFSGVQMSFGGAVEEEQLMISFEKKRKKKEKSLSFKKNKKRKKPT